MRTVFFGTPEFAVASLRALASEHEVCLVVTREDAVRSRGKKLEASPVALAAEELGIEVLKSSRVDDTLIERIRNLKADIGVVAAYGRILPDELLSACEHGFINVHASLLPRWRGAAPIQRAILAGDEELGVSIMQLVHEMDAGAYCCQASTLSGDKCASELTDELAELGAQKLLEALKQIEAGTAFWQEQDDKLVTFAPKVEKQEMLLDPSVAAQENLLRVRASLDTAPARVAVGGKGLRVLEAQVGDGESVSKTEATAGEVLVEGARVSLVCSEGTCLELLRVKPDGKAEMDVSAWANGLQGRELCWLRV